jgi:MoxR-like ATPase
MTTNVTTKKQLNSVETKDVLRHVITNNIKLAEEGKKPVSLSVKGNAGIGKTSIVHQIAEEMKMDFVRVNLAEITPDDKLN